ncbi:MAG: hypothetical protein IT436_18280 [Phycisphaerales bacterium]|nr:hypothetical protein [Phycisphaerales bacterium]
MNRLSAKLTSLAIAGAFALAGCSSGPEASMTRAVQTGQYAQARARLLSRLSDDPSDRSYILDRLRLTVLSLADGLPASADRPANQLFQLLRTQGLNADKTAASVVLNEGVKIWKGEPFEQALGYYYIGVQKGLQGDWDNARAAAGNSLFLLKDFGDNERTGRRKTSEDLAREAARRDREGESGDQYLDKGYTAVKTNFALGYLLNGIANWALSRDDEARDNFAEAARVNAGLEGAARTLSEGRFNTVLIVEAGAGPAKVAYGPDNALARFSPRWPGDARELGVSVGAAAPERFAVACDVNAMATDHMWNNLEDVRQVKSVLGSALLIGGGAVALSSDDSTAQLIGAGAAVLGALMKAGSSADLRYCEVFPQRVYIAPVMIDRPGTRVEVGVDGMPGTRVVIPSMDPPAAGQRVKLHYIRPGAWSVPPVYATAGQIVYGNDAYDGPVPGDDLPYILGGRDCRRPSLEALQHYQRSGNLTDLSLVDLENLYRAEGIQLELEEKKGLTGRHILEGGPSLICPLPGSVGYLRLFGQVHGPYQPKSGELRAVLERWKDAGRARPSAGP